MDRISGDARRELVRAVGDRYRAGSREEKRRILDEFVAVTRCHRKHAIRVLNSRAAAVDSRRTPRARVYDEAVRQALLVFWEASDRSVRQATSPAAAALVAALERHGHLRLEEGVRTRVLNASAATIDRLLAEPRAAARGRLPRRASARPGRPARAWRCARLRTGTTRCPAAWRSTSLPTAVAAWSGSFAHTLDAHRHRERLDRVRRRSSCARGRCRRSARSAPRDDAVPAARHRHRQRQRIHQRDACSRTAPSTESSSRGRARTARTTKRGSSRRTASVVRRLVGYGRLEGIARRRDSGAAVHGVAAVRELLPAVLQARREEPRRARASRSATTRQRRRARDCWRPRRSRGDEGAAASRSGRRSTRSACSTRSGRCRTNSRRSSRARRSTYCRTRNADLEGFLAGLGTAWRTGEVRPTHREGAEAVAPLADAKGSPGDGVALDSIVARSRTRSHGQGIALASPERAARRVCGRPLADDAAPRPRVARRRSQETRVRNRHGVVQRRPHA